MVYTSMPEVEQVQSGKQAGKLIPCSVKCSKCDSIASYYGWVNNDPEVEQVPYTLCGECVASIKSGEIVIK